MSCLHAACALAHLLIQPTAKSYQQLKHAHCCLTRCPSLHHFAYRLMCPTATRAPRHCTTPCTPPPGNTAQVCL
ncbi:hypothetical protein HD554DRAFT_2086450, partial [Boletus coccyginus]